MIGQLGESAIAAIGFSGKFLSLAQTVIAGAATAAGILVAQYEGRHDRMALEQAFTQTLILAMLTGLLFLVPSLLSPGSVLSLYTPDPQVLRPAAIYLRIYAWSVPFSVVTAMVSVVLRCCGSPQAPLRASVWSILANALLDGIFIFGFRMGASGAAAASLLAQILGAGLILNDARRDLGWFRLRASRQGLKTVFRVLIPLIVTEFLWGLGENVYTMVYGHLGTAASAAMTMTIPLQTLLIGILSGLSQAAGILIGQQLGKGDIQAAWNDSLSLIRYSLVGSVILASLLAVLSPLYVRLYAVSDQVRTLCVGLILAFSLMSVIKVQNMVIAGGILRSGGRTGLVLGIDVFGTWVIGVPLALFGASRHLSVILVYLLLSQEEAVRLLISLGIFASRIWIRQIEKPVSD